MLSFVARADFCFLLLSFVLLLSLAFSRFLLLALLLVLLAACCCSAGVKVQNQFLQLLALFAWACVCTIKCGTDFELEL